MTEPQNSPEERINPDGFKMLILQVPNEVDISRIEGMTVDSQFYPMFEAFLHEVWWISLGSPSGPSEKLIW